MLFTEMEKNFVNIPEYCRGAFLFFPHSQNREKNPPR